MITRLLTAPTVEPVALTQTKLHLRLAVTEAAAAAYTTEDALLNALIVAAREYAESYTRRALITQTWKAYLSEWPAGIKEGDEEIRLPYPPFQSVTSITVEGTAFTNFTASLEGILKPTTIWPSLSASPGADPIVITFKAGYGDAAAAVPGQIKQAILLLIGHWYGQREGVLIGVAASPLPLAVEALLNPYRWIDL